MTALALAALAEAAAPYGINSFDCVIESLWHGVKSHKGKTLAAFLKAIGYIIPLMDVQYAAHYTREVMLVLKREFASPDDEMKKIVLKVIKQCVQTEGVEPDYLRNEVLPEYFQHFWVRKMGMDRRNYTVLIDTTHAIALKVGAKEVLTYLVNDLKDENEVRRGTGRRRRRGVG